MRCSRQPTQVHLNHKKSFSFKGLEKAPQGAEKEWKIMYAVIKTGGKQYRVAANDKILIEKLEGAAGDHISFTDVFMVVNGADVSVGAPTVAGATVVGEIEKQARGPHLIIFKKRRRKHYRRRNGHRQDLTSVIITEILTGGAKPTGKRAEVKAVAAPAAVAAAAEKAAAPTTSMVTGDDISLIGGIGPKIHMALSNLNITSFAQIAAWTPEDVERIETEIKQKGRVAREEWIEQAKELMAGKPPRAKTDKART
jgi:large subunit ribosomal protein L21